MKQHEYIVLAIWIAAASAAMSPEDCEIHAPETMHEFCCDIHDENIEMMECQIQWSDKIHHTDEEQQILYNFCVSECVYNKTEYLGADRKSLRMPVIKHHLGELHGDEEAETLMYKTFEMCAKHAGDMLQSDVIKQLEIRLAKHECHPYPGLVFECVSNELILNCPPKKYHGSAQCDYARDYLKACRKQ